MKKLKTTLTIFLLASCLGCTNKQEKADYSQGSNVVFDGFGKNDIKDFVLLGKVWGFLKYHHPEIAAGKHNWDHELFRILPDYLNAGNTSARNGLLSDWIKSLGKVQVCNSCGSGSKKMFYILPEHTWFDASNVSEELSTKLHFIYDNRNQFEHYYVKQVPVIGKPEFSNEDDYSTFPYPDAGYRLLALYRYWNIIEYFFPSKYLIESDWDDVLEKYISEFVFAVDELQYEMAVAKLVGEIHDSHGQLFGSVNRLRDYFGSNYAPIALKYVENKFVVSELYEGFTHTLSLGDIVTHINGKPIEETVKQKEDFISASNEATKMRDICGSLIMSSEKELAFTVNEGTIKKVTFFDLTEYRKKRIIKSEKAFSMLKGNIGYVTLASITAEDVISIKEEFKNTKGIIIDIRNYPSAFVAHSLGSFFIDKTTAFARFTNFVPTNPGQFKFTQEESISLDIEQYKGKLVVLVNEQTQSQAEFTAMAFRAGRNTLILGSTTAGADGDVSTIPLPGGLSTRISGIGVYYPDSTQTQRVGIIPDVYVEPTIAGLKQGRDELLEKAVAIISN